MIERLQNQTGNTAAVVEKIQMGKMPAYTQNNGQSPMHQKGGPNFSTSAINVSHQIDNQRDISSFENY
jgi:hypothetical protein